MPKEDKISVLLDVREAATDLYHNVLYLQNYDIDNVMLLDKCQKVINEINDLIYRIETSEE